MSTQDFVNTVLGFGQEWWPEIKVFGGIIILVVLVIIYIKDWRESKKRKTGGKFTKDEAAAEINKILDRL